MSICVDDTDQISLYTVNTANGFRAALALAECQIEHKLHTISLDKRDDRRTGAVALSPSGSFPFLVQKSKDGTPFVLGQSSAILIFAAEESGRFLPRDGRRRADILYWVLQAVTDVQCASAALYHSENVYRSTRGADFHRGRVIRFLRLWNSRLAQSEYVANDYSVADIALYPTLLFRQEIVEEINEFSHLRRWFATMNARPTVALVQSALDHGESANLRSC